jgi:hypothetical protein
MPVVCESVGEIGTVFFEISRRFSSAVDSGLVGLLVSEDDAEHTWWFRTAEPADAVW